MTPDLRARIVAALEECRVLIPETQADAVMAVIEAERDRWILDYLRTHPDETARLMRAEMGRLARRNVETRIYICPGCTRRVEPIDVGATWGPGGILWCSETCFAGDAVLAEPEDARPRSFVDQNADPNLIRRRR